VSTLLYRATVRLSRVLGMWIVRVMGAIIAAAYYWSFLETPAAACASIVRSSPSDRGCMLSAAPPRMVRPILSNGRTSEVLHKS